MSVIAEQIAEESTQEMVFTTRVSTMEALHDKQAYLISIYGEMTLEDYKQVYPKALEFVVESGWKKLIFNLLELTKDDSQGRAWYLRKHLPEVWKKMGGGFKCALIQPTSAFQRMAMNLIVKGVKAMGKDIELKFFDTEEEAIAWM